MIKYAHIVQNNAEESVIKKSGGLVVLNLAKAIRSSFGQSKPLSWQEPKDFREVTGFPWNPVLADRHLINFSVHLRKKIAGILFAALSELFAQNKFTACISEPVVLFPTHCLYYLCKKHHVSPLFWSSAYFPGHHYFSEGCDNSNPINSILTEKPASQKVKSKVLSFAQGVINDRAGPEYHPKFVLKKLPTYKNYFAQRKGTISLFQNVDLVTIMIQLARLLRSYIYKIGFLKFGDYMVAGSVKEHLFYLDCMLNSFFIYDKLPKRLCKRSFVFPLQFEPEGSLSYFAPENQNQVAFVELIARTLPAQFILYVKEHPNQCGALRTKKWRILKKQFCNLKFIHGCASGRLLIKKTVGVITISSTMGMDALLLGRQVYLAGKVFYQNFTGVIKIKSINQLAQIIQNSPKLLTRSEIQRVFQNLQEFCLKTRAGDPQPSHNLFDRQNIIYLIKSIHEQVK